MTEHLRKESWTDVVNLAFGALLFLSPWIFGFVPEAAASWNAWIAGIAIGALAVAALWVYAEWQEWVSLLAGLWVIIAPWALGFSAAANAVTVHVITGLVVAVVAAGRLWYSRNHSQRITT